MSWRCIHGNVLFMGELSEEKMCFCRSNALIPCSFCDSKINKYIYWLYRLWIYRHFEYVDCNIWFLDLSVLLSSTPSMPIFGNLHRQKACLLTNYTRMIHAHVYHQYDTYVAEFHKKRKMYPSSVEDKWCWEVNLSFKLIMTISWSTKKGGGGCCRTYRTWRKHMENQNRILKPSTLSC